MYETFIACILQPPTSDTKAGIINVKDVGFLHGFVASLSVILVSEIGDKTFFIAAIMAMRHPRITVFGGAISALALMTILSGRSETILTKVIYNPCSICQFTLIKF